MMKLYSNCPTLDLHGETSDFARIQINDFVRDNYDLSNDTVIIIHGIGTGILRKTTQQVLSKNKYVETYKIDNFNDGQTIVKLRKKI
ncbi:MAG: Smr/MutS family protein [Bacilli bacterium]|nr:Smr/MutS family protein [Bacilli bacterium]